jgi:hypothetical protein
MQQTVIAARGAGGYVGAFYQQRPEPAHGAVPLRPGPRNAASNDNNVKLVGIHVCLGISFIFQRYAFFANGKNFKIYLQSPKKTLPLQSKTTVL